MSLFKGCCVAMCTPFSQNGVNYDTAAKLIDRHLTCGTDALLVCGTTGEPSTMTKEEKRGLIEFAVSRVAGRIPVIAGTGGNDTAKVIEDSKAAAALHADALLVVTPYYNKCTQNGLYEHFRAVCEAVDIPVILYNVPSRTGVNVRPETWARIARIDNIDGIKEASSDIVQIARMARLTGLSKAIYSGNDDQVLPILSLGGSGVISVTANVAPKLMHDMCAKYFAGDTAGARELQFAADPLTEALFSEVNPIPAKTALSMQGYDMGELRLPLTPMEEGNRARLAKEMAALRL